MAHGFVTSTIFRQAQFSRGKASRDDPGPRATPIQAVGQWGRLLRGVAKTSDGDDESPVEVVGRRGMMSEDGRQIRDSAALASSSL
jgi:hypothetical protein